MPNSVGIDDLIRDDYDQDNDDIVPSAPGRKPAEPNRLAIKPRNTQAWRELEDRLEDKRLRDTLKEWDDD